jgi:asparagine N-glycosylation enzyme membrane subunit Stt3
MDNSFVSLLQLLEILAFFSGYPMIYLLVKYLDQYQGMQRFTQKAISILPLVYGILGILFVGLELKNLYVDFNLARFEHPYLISWGISSLLFLFPFFSKRPYWSFWHSLIFLLILVEKIIFGDFSPEGKSQQIKNYMTIYSISLAINFVLLLLTLAASQFWRKIKGTKS